MDEFVSMKNVVTFGAIQPGIVCKACESQDTLERQLNDVKGWDAVSCPSEYEYTHKAMPKTVTDSRGNKRAFNPTSMPKGRKGSGR